MANVEDISIDRMVRAVEKVRERLRRTVAALEDAGIPYGIVGGNAVAAWVSSVDDAAVRNTRDVDVLLERKDLPAATRAMESAGFIHRHVKSIDLFLDGPEAKARDAVHVIFAGEKVRADDATTAPGIQDTEHTGEMRIVKLDSLVRMKLTSYRDKDRTHLRDMIETGLIDDTWPARFLPELAARLRLLLDDPDG
jgi:hypothetical protein